MKSDMPVTDSIRQTGEEEIQMTLEAAIRVGGEWPDETARLGVLLRDICSSTGDQMGGGEWTDRTIGITIFVDPADMSEPL